MRGHAHNPSAGTQNQGNSLGDRSCVRQSKLYRMYESGNGVKSVLGTSHLCWDPNVKQGAYDGQKVYDHNLDNPLKNSDSYYRAPPQDVYSKTSQDYGVPRDSNARDYDYRHERNERAAAIPRDPHDFRTTRTIPRDDDLETKDYSRNRAPPQDKNYGRRSSFESDSYQRPSRNDSAGSNLSQYYDRKASNPISHNDENYYASSNRSQEDRSYRNIKEQSQQSSNYQSRRQDSFGGERSEQEKSSIRVYQDNRSTRPW